MTHIDTHDLDWLAFRYIADEMTDDERLAFENQLADDQAAREALASAVELTEVLMVTKGDSDVSTPASPTTAEVQLPARGVWLKPAAWMSAGAAACLVAVFISQTMNGWKNVASTINQNSGAVNLVTAGENNLALVWSQTRLSEQTSTLEDEDAAVSESNDTDDPMGLTELQTTINHHAKTPSWIVAAVSALSDTNSTKPETDDDTEEL